MKLIYNLINENGGFVTTIISSLNSLIISELYSNKPDSIGVLISLIPS